MTQITIRIYSPDIRESSISDLGPSDRAKHISGVIQTAYKGGANIFLGPEYLFSYNTERLPYACRPYSHDESMMVRDIIKEMSVKTVGMLIVPGTIFEILGSYRPCVFNSAFAIKDGELVKSVSKTAHASDTLYAKQCGYEYYAVPDIEANAYFKYKGLDICIQICTDLTIEPPGDVAIGLHPAFAPGGVLLHTLEHQHKPTLRAIADGQGQYVIRGAVKLSGGKEGRILEVEL